MKKIGIDDIKPIEPYIILDEKTINVKESKIELLDDTKEKIGQRAYTVMCVNSKSKYKVDDTLIISAQPIFTPIKIGEKIYLIINEYDIRATI